MGILAAAAAPPLSELAAEINQNHELAVMYVGQSFDHAVKAGLLLLQAKQQVKHGEWAKWLKANVKIGARQAQNYMKVASCPEQKRNAVADLSLRKAIHELASHKVMKGDPEGARALTSPKDFAPTPEATEPEPLVAEHDRAPDDDEQPTIEIIEPDDGAEQDAAPAPACDVHATSWMVEAVSMDGRVWRDGVRLPTMEQAQAYIEWFARHDVGGFAAAGIIKSDDRPRQKIIGKKRKTLLFEHGTCGSLHWTETQEKPSSETIAAVQEKAAAWADLAARLKRASTLPQDGRSEVGMDDPTQSVVDDVVDWLIGDIPPELDRRKKTA
jgi:DUF3102 family protein